MSTRPVGSLVPVAITEGGTGATTASGARTNLGLGTIATQDANNVNITGGAITGMPMPLVSSDVANKGYVDLVGGLGLSIQTACVAATTGNLTAVYANGAAGVGATLTNSGIMAAFSIDGISPALNSRILVKDQSTTFQNGIYTLTTVGSGASNWILTRATDNDQTTELKAGNLVLINTGTLNANTSWLETATITMIGVDPVLYTEFTSNPATFLKVSNNLSDVSSIPMSVANLGLTIGTNTEAWSAQLDSIAAIGNGIPAHTAANTFTARTLTGTMNRLSVSNGDGVAGNPTFDIDAAYIGQASITTLGTITSGTWNSSIITGTYGGTGINNGTKTITLGGNLTTSGAFNSTFTMTADTGVTFPVSGTLATTADIPTGAALTRTNDTNVTLTLGGTPATSLLQATSLTLGWTGQLAGSRGGTGVNNGTNTITLGGNLTTSGAFDTTLTVTGLTNVTLPTSGTLATTSQIPTGAALTRTNDTNVTVTLGGSPNTSLVNAASLTLGWTGTLSPARGGTGLGSYTTGDIIYASGATTLAGLADVATGQVLVSGGVATAPAYSSTPTVTTITTTTSTLTNLLDARTATTLAIGTTTATAIGLNQSTTMAANMNFSAAAGTSAFSWGSATGATTFGTGNISWTGTNTSSLSLINTSTSNIINFTIGNLSTSNSSNFNIKGNNIRLQTQGGTDILWLNLSSGGGMTFYGGTFDTSGGSQAFNWGGATGNFSISTGNLSWAGAASSTLSFVTGGTSLIQSTGTANNVTIRSSGTSANVTIDGTTGVTLQRGGSAIADAGITTSTDFTIEANKNLTGAAGAGVITWTKTSIGSAQTAGWTLKNTTAAANNAQQYSPMLVLEGQGNNTISGTQQADVGIQCRPVQGSTLLTDIVFYASVNGGAYAEMASIHKSGLIDAILGYQIGGGAISGRYLRGDGTSFNSQNIQSGDLPTTISGAHTLSGAITFSGGILASGTNANSWGGGSGDFTLSTGAVSWTGDSNKALTFTGSGTGAFTLNSGTSGIVFQRSSTTLLDIGNTTSTAVTLATGKTFVAGSNTLIGSVTDKLNAAMLAIASQATGDILYADTTTTFARLAKGTDGQILSLASGLPSWINNPPSSAIVTTVGFGVVSNATTYYPSTPVALTTASETFAWRVYAPANSTWKIRLAVDAAVAGGETLTMVCRYASTLNGAYADQGSAITRVNADGTTVVESATLTPSAGYLTFKVSYTAVAALSAQIYMELIRLT